MLLRSPATNQRPADRTGRPADEDSHRTSSITAARSSAWPSMSFTDEGAASLLLVVLIRCPPWRSYLVQAARHGPALPRAPVRRARTHCGAPTGRHGAERSARDAERGGVRGEMRSRATSSSTMARSAVRIPPRIGWKDLTRTPSATPSARPAADGPPRSSFATDARSCADDEVAKVLADPVSAAPAWFWTDRACPRLGTARRSVGARIIACGRLPSAAMASKGARSLLPAIYTDDGCSSYDGGSHVISAARS
jgi:hypothetical protein